MQKICNLQTGDCARACIASIFELPIDAVPNFMMGGSDHYRTHLNRWCDQLGIVAVDIGFHDSKLKYLINDCYVIAAIKSQRDHTWEDMDPEYKEKYKDAMHAVVWYNGKVAHDPYPGGKPPDEEPELFTVFIIKNPAKTLNLDIFRNKKVIS